MQKTNTLHKTLFQTNSDHVGSRHAKLPGCRTSFLIGCLRGPPSVMANRRLFAVNPDTPEPQSVSITRLSVMEQPQTS